MAAKQNLANTRTQRTKDKETLKKAYRRTHETTVATNTTGGQQKKHGGRGHSKQATQTKGKYLSKHGKMFEQKGLKQNFEEKLENTPSI